MAVLTDKQESLVRTISITGMSTDRACFARIVGVHLDSHAPVQESLIGQHALQFSKRPLGIGRIRLSLPDAGFLALLAAGSLSNIGQIFQADQAVGVSVNDALRDHMIGVLLQPSLSSTDDDKSSCCGASAFLLKTLSQSRKMVCLGNNGFACVEGAIALGRRGHRQVAYTHIYPNYPRMGLRCWVWCLNFKGDEQIELLLGFVVPEFGRTNLGTLLDQGNMRVAAFVGYNHTPFQSQDTQALLCLETVVFAMLVRQGRRHVLGRLVQALIPLLGLACLAVCGILLDLGPQGFIRGTDLPGNTACHLGRQMKTGTNLIIGSILQSNAIAHLAMLKSVTAHVIERIPIGQLRGPQGRKLFRISMQFEFCRYHRFHISYCIKVSTTYQDTKMVEDFPLVVAFFPPAP